MVVNSECEREILLKKFDTEPLSTALGGDWNAIAALIFTALCAFLLPAQGSTFRRLDFTCT